MERGKGFDIPKRGMRGEGKTQNETNIRDLDYSDRRGITAYNI
jgi:hypothetical protein